MLVQRWPDHWCRPVLARGSLELLRSSHQLTNSLQWHRVDFQDQFGTFCCVQLAGLESNHEPVIMMHQRCWKHHIRSPLRTVYF